MFQQLLGEPLLHTFVEGLIGLPKGIKFTSIKLSPLANVEEMEAVLLLLFACNETLRSIFLTIIPSGKLRIKTSGNWGTDCAVAVETGSWAGLSHLSSPDQTVSVLEIITLSIAPRTSMSQFAKMLPFIVGAASALRKLVFSCGADDYERKDEWRNIDQILECFHEQRPTSMFTVELRFYSMGDIGCDGYDTMLPAMKDKGLVTVIVVSDGGE